MVASLRRFSKDEVAQQRLKIIKFYERHGEQATKEAFAVDRRLISKWRKRLKENGGRLEVLIPHIISMRYEKGSIILTSNYNFDGWGKVFDDNVVASAIIDRLVHHANV